MRGLFSVFCGLVGGSGGRVCTFFQTFADDVQATVELRSLGLGEAYADLVQNVIDLFGYGLAQFSTGAGQGDRGFVPFGLIGAVGNIASFL